MNSDVMFVLFFIMVALVAHSRAITVPACFGRLQRLGGRMGIADRSSPDDGDHDHAVTEAYLSIYRIICT